MHLPRPMSHDKDKSCFVKNNFDLPNVVIEARVTHIITSVHVTWCVFFEDRFTVYAYQANHAIIH